MLVSDGYAALSMRKIAQKAGYSATAIYLHFAGKDALIHDLIDEGMTLLYERLKGAGHEGSLEERLRRLCHAYISFGKENPEYYEVMFLLHPDRMERYPPDKYRRARRSLDVITDLLMEDRFQSTRPVDEVRACASAIWAALHGSVAIVLANRLDVRIREDRFVHESVDQVIRAHLYQSEMKKRQGETA
jgi:AcrR family transcriptional regulator